jgi:hypothetical protein
MYIFSVKKTVGESPTLFSNLFVRGSNEIVYSKDNLDEKSIGSMFINSLVNFSKSISYLNKVLPEDTSHPENGDKVALKIKSLLSVYPSQSDGEPFVYGNEFSTDSINVLTLSFVNGDRKGKYGTFSELFLGEKFGYFYDDRWSKLVNSGIGFFDIGSTQEFYKGLVTQLSSIDLSSKDKEDVWRDTSKYSYVIDFLKKNKDLETFSDEVYNILVPIEKEKSTVRYAMPSDFVFSKKGSPFLRFYINITSDVTKMISGTSGNKGKKS